MTGETGRRRAQVIGIGMIGGSVAAALRGQGWHVTGDDVAPGRAEEAKALGFVDAVGIDDGAEITFVATPVSAIAERSRAALERGGIVTDVGSVKATVVDAVAHPRFIGGHPMAGSERDGLDGVDPDLFSGATWVLTPSALTDPEVYVQVHNVVTELGASIVTLDAQEHDDIVATVSHVPHFAAVALMVLALQRSHKHEAVLRLAATGFRDMTRIAAGHPRLWADIAVANRDALVEGLEHLVTGIDELRELVASGERDRLEAVLAEASTARRELPLRAGRPSGLVLLRIPIPDRPGALGEVLGVFGELRVNVEDLEIAHDIKGDRGTLQVTVAVESGERVRDALAAKGMRIAMEAM